MEETTENLDSSNETANEIAVETQEDATTEESTETTDGVDVAQLQATNKKLYERAKTAEAALKTAKAQSASSQPNVEEAATIAALQVNGMSDELVSELKTVAKVRGISLLKAQTDPIFIAVKDKFEKDQKQKEATLGASRGSGQAKVKKDFNTPGLTRDEHRKMVLG